jgi:SAM-dependent methyltransferase
MGYVFSYSDARAYEEWLTVPDNRIFLDEGHRLMFRMLEPMPGETVLDIGCGTGATLLALLDAGLRPTGLDASPHALDIAWSKLKNRVDMHRGEAEDLPFDDNSFSYSVLINTLEYVQDPQKVLEEAFRVTKDRIFIGILNRHSGRAARQRVQRIFIPGIYSHARFFSVWEIKQMARMLAGDVPLIWRSVCRIPNPVNWIFNHIGPWSLTWKSPFSPFVGIVVVLKPRFRTRPLELNYRSTALAAGAAGLALESEESQWKHTSMKVQRKNR